MLHFLRLQSLHGHFPHNYLLNYAFVGPISIFYLSELKKKNNIQNKDKINILILRKTENTKTVIKNKTKQL